MYNSTIIVKKRKLACGCFDFAFSRNKCKFHAGLENTQKRIDKAKNDIHVTDELRTKVESNNAELNRWFNERRKEMTGFCANCGGKSCKNDDKYFKFSIAHILPKAYFGSVKTHADNWIELCFWGQSCHTNYDNKILDITELNCFDQAIIKFQKIYPFIAAKERRRIPDTLLQYLNTDL